MNEYERRALGWLAEHGGGGYVTAMDNIVARGATSTMFRPAVFLQLVALGLVDGGDGYVTITDKGWEELKDQ